MQLSYGELHRRATQVSGELLRRLRGRLSGEPRLARPARARQSEHPARPEQPERPRIGRLDRWDERLGATTDELIAMAEDFPEDKYDFKPTPAQRSFAEQLLHVAGANYFFINPVMGQKPPAAEDPKRDQYKTKADVVAFVKKSFADGAAAIQHARAANRDKGLAERATQ